MKKLLALIFIATVTKVGYSQEAIKNDTIFQLNNEVIICKVSNISEFEIVYSYIGESLTNSISKKQVKEIHFGSGRIQKFSQLIAINGEEDWEKVQLTTLPSDVVGLVKKGEVKGKAWGSTVEDMTDLKNRAEEKIKREAAKLGCHIVLIQMYNTVDGQAFVTNAKANINGVAYSYK
ncbi:MAG TPA: hypothetical protein VE978_24515 [Chitinophagales bacterium]|nr:hypothetical protein [Chitinophagales bacterium]